MRFEIYRCFEVNEMCYFSLEDAEKLGEGMVIREKRCAFLEGINPPTIFPIAVTEACEDEFEELLNKLYVVAVKKMLVDYRDIEIEQVGQAIEFSGNYTDTIQKNHIVKAISNSNLRSNGDTYYSGMFLSFFMYENASWGYMNTDVLEISTPVEMLESYMHILEEEDRKIENV